MVLTGHDGGGKLDELSVNDAYNRYLQRTLFMTKNGDTALHVCVY